MRTRINNITFTPGTRSINTGISDLSIDDIRLIINESQNKVICSSMQKNNIISINSGVVTYKDTFPVLALEDHITFEIDMGDNLSSIEQDIEIIDDKIGTPAVGQPPTLFEAIRQGGGGGGSSIEPVVVVEDDDATFKFVTLQQMEQMTITTTDGDITFALTTDEDYFYLNITSSSPDPVAGDLVLQGDLSEIGYVYGSIVVHMQPDAEVTSITLADIDKNLLDADVNWRLADIQREVFGVHTLLDEINGVNMPVEFATDYAKQGSNPLATNTAILQEISDSEIGTELTTGKTAIASAIVQKGGTATATDSLAQLASEVQNIPNVTKQFVQTDFIDVLTGVDDFDCLKLIHSYYNPLYPTSVCYLIRANTTFSIPQGAAKMICRNSAGNIITIDNPSGNYTIYGKEDEGVGFCLLQYVNRTISLAGSSDSRIMSLGVYNADVTFQNFQSVNIFVVQLEDCDISFSTGAFTGSLLKFFNLYGNCAFSDIPASVTSLFATSQLVAVNYPNLISSGGQSLLRDCQQLTSASLPDLETASGGLMFYNSSRLVNISLPKLVSLSNDGNFRELGSITTLSLPKLETANGTMNFYTCGNLRELRLPKIRTLGASQTFTNCNNLILLELGENINANLNINTWNPTNALSSSSASLVYTGETFSSNLEKLLYNIRNHIATNLPDRTGLSALTITFSSAVKSAINGDTATAQAFANKNWTIA